MNTYSSNSLYLKKKRFFFLLSLALSLFSRSHLLTTPVCFFFSFLCLFDFLSFFFTMCPSLIRVRLYPETIYLFSVQFILHELSSSHFLTSEILIKISSMESLATYHLETRKKILIILEFYEIFLGHYISRDEFNGVIGLVIRDLENFLGFPKPLWQFIITIIIIIIIIIIIFPFLKISNFPGFYILPPLTEFCPRNSHMLAHKNTCICNNILMPNIGPHTFVLK